MMAALVLMAATCMTGTSSCSKIYTIKGCLFIVQTICHRQKCLLAIVSKFYQDFAPLLPQCCPIIAPMLPLHSLIVAPLFHLYCPMMPHCFPIVAPLFPLCCHNFPPSLPPYFPSWSLFIPPHFPSFSPLFPPSFPLMPPSVSVAAHVSCKFAHNRVHLRKCDSKTKLRRLQLLAVGSLI